MNNLYTVGPRKARELLIDCLQSDVTAMLSGPPGCGKSQLNHSIADEAFLEMIDHRASTSVPEDFTGLPRFNERGEAVFSPFAELFPLDDRPLPDGKNGYMLFLDEFNSAKEDVQAAAYKLILDRKIGQRNLHPKCAIVAAGNRLGDRAIVNELGTAMQSRMAHIEMEVVFREWLEDVAIKFDYDYRIIAFLSRYPNYLMDFRADHDDKTFCCPRTWEFMDRFVRGKVYKEIEQTRDGVTQTLYEMDGKAALYAGTITSGVAAEFIRFTRVSTQLLGLDEIMSNPTGVPIPGDPNLMWTTISYVMQHVNEDNFTSLGMFANRFEMSFKILFFRAVMAKHAATLRHHPTFQQAQIELSRYLNG